MRSLFDIFFRVLERIGARALSAHLRKLCDYLAYDFANSGQNQTINKRVDAVNDLIWKYNVVTLDRLVLCLVSHPRSMLLVEISMQIFYPHI